MPEKYKDFIKNKVPYLIGIKVKTGKGLIVN